ncbi:MAG TPA: TlpA disulfide reductase family protein [Pyrinomonadaceae bacterium]|nr:TlpA disulfide reductase family protein [Pyrinomonadaceae bacterium]
MKRFVLSLALSLAFVSVGAATVRAQEKKPSAGGAAVKLEGQVVCSLCWFEEADRTKTPYGTAENLECALECAEKGIDAALAVREGAGKTFALYLLEDGRFDKGAKNWLAYMGKRVEVAGTVRRAGGSKNYLKVNSLSVVAGADGASVPVLQDAKVIGTEAELALKDLFGAEQRLSALRGRIVVLNFWATYCVPCRKEMPDLARIQNNYAALGVQVIGATAEDAAARPKVMQFIKETKLNFPVWLGATTGDMERFGLAPVLPGTVIIGRDGRIVWHRSGVVKEADVKQKIDELLAQSAKAEGSAPDAAPRAEAPARVKAAGETREEHASSVPS